jgi:hypothetical protein
MSTYCDLVDYVVCELGGRGGAQGTRPIPSSTSKSEKAPDKKPEGSRESRSVQQVIAFSSPSFPA